MNNFSPQGFQSSNSGREHAITSNDQPASQYIFIPPDPSSSASKGFSKWILPAIGSLMIILIVVLMVVLITPPNSDDDVELNEQDLINVALEEDAADLYAFESALGEKDNLNHDYAIAVASNPYASYETTLDSTLLLEHTPSEICMLLSVYCHELAHPEQLSSFTKVAALNTNALDYYLDTGHIVIFSASGNDPYTTEGNVLVIYAANYAQGHVFTAFTPSAYDMVSPLVELRRDSVINGITGVPDCYISKEVF